MSHFNTWSEMNDYVFGTLKFLREKHASQGVIVTPDDIGHILYQIGCLDKTGPPTIKGRFRRQSWKSLAKALRYESVRLQTWCDRQFQDLSYQSFDEETLRGLAVLLTSMATVVKHFHHFKKGVQKTRL